MQRLLTAAAQDTRPQAERQAVAVKHECRVSLPRNSLETPEDDLATLALKQQPEFM